MATAELAVIALGWPVVLRAFGGHPADQPVGATAARAMVDLMLAVDGVIAALERPSHFSQDRVGGHG